MTAATAASSKDTPEGDLEVKSGTVQFKSGTSQIK